MMHANLRSTRHAALIPRIVLVVCFGVIVLTHGAWAVEPPPTRMDCTVYETKRTSIGLWLKIGNFVFAAGPEISFTKERGVAWNTVVQGLIARYTELCTRYNAGLVSKDEYKHYLHEIEGLYREAQALEAKMFEDTRDSAQDAHDELDRVLSSTPPATRQSRQDFDPVVKELRGLSGSIDQLEPIGRPLKPKRPGPPPDGLGSPGALENR